MRKSRQEIKIEEEKFLEYMDPLEFGTAKDPCFGKYFSLTAEECQLCGDSVFCANKVKLNLKLAIDSDEQLDTQLVQAEISAAEKYIENKVKKGKSEQLIIKMTKKKFQTPTPKIKEFINKYK